MSRFQKCKVVTKKTKIYQEIPNFLSLIRVATAQNSQQFRVKKYFLIGYLLESGLATEFVTDFLPIVIDSTAVVIKYNVIKDLLIKKVHYCLSNSMQGSAKGLNFIDH